MKIIRFLQESYLVWRFSAINTVPVEIPKKNHGLAWDKNYIFTFAYFKNILIEIWTTYRWDDCGMIFLSKRDSLFKNLQKKLKVRIIVCRSDKNSQLCSQRYLCNLISFPKSRYSMLWNKPSKYLLTYLSTYH